MKPRRVFIGVTIIAQVIRDVQANDAADREPTLAGIHRPCWRTLLICLFGGLLYTSAFALDARWFGCREIIIPPASRSPSP